MNNKDLKLIKELKNIIKNTEEHINYLRSTKNYKAIQEQQKFIKEVEELIINIKNN